MKNLGAVDQLLRLALAEDIGPCDATVAALVEPTATAAGSFRARQAGVMAGGKVLARLFELLDNRVRVETTLPDGRPFEAGDVLARIHGPAGPILSGERTALNLLQRMCSVAARTRAYVDAVAGTKAKILDTRKTLPGHRALDKMAVAAGGGTNHRMGLYDMILVKDNHLVLHGGPGGAVRQARKRSQLPIMVEVDTLEQLRDALAAEPDYVLLDNMSPETMATAVALTDRLCAESDWKRPQLEASGGITLATVAAVAASGVDRISVGALTHAAGSVDIGLDFDDANA